MRGVDYVYAALGIAFIVGVVRPVLWWILLSLSLWVGRMVLSDRVGLVLFGGYWKKRQEPQEAFFQQSGSRGKRGASAQLSRRP